MTANSNFSSGLSFYPTPGLKLTCLINRRIGGMGGAILHALLPLNHYQFRVCIEQNLECVLCCLLTSELDLLPFPHSPEINHKIIQ